IIQRTAIVPASTSSQSAVEIPGLSFSIGDDIWPDMLITLCVPYFYVMGVTGGANQGATFSIQMTLPLGSPKVIATGGYTWPVGVSQGNGRLPLTLTGFIPAGGNRKGPNISAMWSVIGDGVSANIDSDGTTTLIAVKAIELPSRP